MVSSTFRSLPRRLAVIGLCFVVVGCGAAGEGGSPEAPDQVTVAPARFEGDYTITGALFDGEPVAALATDPMTLAIDVEAASVVVTSSCRTYIGSFTLGDGEGTGPVSFTIPGSTDENCRADQDVTQQLVIAMLETVTTWKASGVDTVTLDGPGAELSLKAGG